MRLVNHEKVPVPVWHFTAYKIRRVVYQRGRRYAQRQPKTDSSYVIIIQLSLLYVSDVKAPILIL